MKVQRKKMAAWQAKPYCIQLWGINNLQNKTQTVSHQISYPNIVRTHTPPQKKMKQKKLEWVNLGGISRVIFPTGFLVVSF
jgi:hypothetical protein